MGAPDVRDRRVTPVVVAMLTVFSLSLASTTSPSASSRFDQIEIPKTRSRIYIYKLEPELCIC